MFFTEILVFWFKINWSLLTSWQVLLQMKRAIWNVNYMHWIIIPLSQWWWYRSLNGAHNMIINKKVNQQYIYASLRKWKPFSAIHLGVTREMTALFSNAFMRHKGYDRCFQHGIHLWLKFQNDFIINEHFKENISSSQFPAPTIPVCDRWVVWKWQPWLANSINCGESQ